MWGRLGPRFALEAAFLILLAVALGIADQDWVVIVAVMAGGWALVSLIELVASRRPPWDAVPGAASPQPREAEPPVATGNAAPPPPPEPAASAAWTEPPTPDAAPPEPAREAQPAPVPASGPPASAAPTGEPAAAAEPAVPEDTQEVPPEEAVVEPPRPRRRWFRRSRTDAHHDVQEPPKHVRKLDRDADGDVADGIDESGGAEAPAAADSGDDRS